MNPELTEAEGTDCEKSSDGLNDYGFLLLNEQDKVENETEYVLYLSLGKEDDVNVSLNTEHFYVTVMKRIWQINN